MISMRNKIVSVGVAIAFLSMTSGLPEALAAPKANSISIVPTITSLSLVNGVLTATGIATATINGQTTTVPFAAPVDITAVPSQPGVCPVLDLTLGPIHLNLLGLDVQTSPICLTITAIQGGVYSASPLWSRQFAESRRINEPVRSRTRQSQESCAHGDFAGTSSSLLNFASGVGSASPEPAWT